MLSEESRNYVREFIIKKDGKATKNDVVRYMDSKAVPENFRTSRVTTFGIIEEFELSKQIKVSRGKRRGQSHNLIFNDYSSFNIIDKELSEINQLIESIDEPVRKIHKLKKTDISDTDFEPYSNLLLHYSSIVITMLQFWLGRINTLIRDDTITLQFYTRVIELIQKLNLQCYNMTSPRQYYEYYLKDKLSAMLDVKYELPSPDKRKIIDEALIDDIIDKVERFEYFAKVD